MPVPISAIERLTGLTKEVVRVWESRYGFPQPDRDENGDRIYPAEQIVRLRLIRRLLVAGLGPRRVVALDLAQLESLVARLADDEGLTPSDGCRQIFDAVFHHDLVALTHLLRGQLNRQGLALFVRESVSPLNVIVGDAWLRGEIRVFQEHLYTEVVKDVLRDAIRTVTDSLGSPRVLLSTPPGELHTVGLLMATAILSLEGACCIRLGAQNPTEELVIAAKACRIDIIGLSFSVAHSVRTAARYLRDLRNQLDPDIEIWAGGAGVSKLGRIDGVRRMHSLDGIGSAIHAWRTLKATQPG
jgi:DNA-binding transcriptional MerR regulator/methylmalonyl-CoA mutase cobalamin-binding subunit